MRRLATAVLALAACSSPNQPPGHTGIDASADSAASSDTPLDAADPAGLGPATVTTSTVQIPGATSGRTLNATVYLPSGPGPHPLVVVSPGFQMARTQYASYSQHLATWGFVVVLTDYADTSFFPNHQKMADDITAVITWSLAQSSLAVGSDTIAVAGHSLGGKLSVFAATQDVRIKAVVGWDPVDSNNPSVAPEKMVSLHAAVAVVGETTDGAGGGMPCAPTADNYKAFYAASPSPAYALTINAADHMDWVDDGSCATCGFCTAGTASPDAVHAISRRVDVAWLRRQLLADTTMDVWLTNPPELATNTVEIEHH